MVRNRAENERVTYLATDGVGLRGQGRREAERTARLCATVRSEGVTGWTKVVEVSTAQASRVTSDIGWME